MNLRGQRVIRPRDFEQIFKLPLKFQVFLPQDGNVALDERNGPASNVWQSEYA